jgi:uncharacterized membrane protein YdcZ (DUF606 family)
VTRLVLAAGRTETSPALTIVFGVVFFLVGILAIAISRLPNERNSDSQRWSYWGPGLIGAWLFVTIGPVLVLVGLARLMR